MKLATRAAALFLAFLLPAGTFAAADGPLADAPSPWAADEVSQAIEMGLVPEFLQNHYQSVVTRREYCHLAMAWLETAAEMPYRQFLEARGLAIDPDAFTDTGDEMALAACALGVVQGRGGGIFAPGDAIDRANAAVLSVNAGKVFDEYAGLPYVYDDAAYIPVWARDSVWAARAAGVMGGSALNEFLPDRPYTREQAIITMLRLYKARGGELDAPLDLYPMSAPVDGAYRWGYVDAGGRFVIQPKYLYASKWNNGYGIVSWPEDPEQCFVIDRAGKRVTFDYYGAEYDTFSLSFDNGAPSVHWAGNCLTVEDFYALFSLSDFQAVADSVFFEFYAGGIICVRPWRGDDKLNYDREGNLAFRTYGQTGAFYDGVGVTWGGLIDKKGKVVYQFDFFSMPDIVVYGVSSVTNWVGDSLVFIKPKRKPDGEWEPAGYGVVRADGNIILPAEYDFVRLTPCKQILTAKEGETYTLRDASGKAIYRFPTYMTGAFHYDGIGHYLYRASGGELVALSVSGEVTATLPVSETAAACFVGGLIQVIEQDGQGQCRYYGVDGKSVF